MYKMIMKQRYLFCTLIHSKYSVIMLDKYKPRLTRSENRRITSSFKETRRTYYVVTIDDKLT